MNKNLTDTLGGAFFWLFGAAMLYVIPYQMPDEDPLMLLGPATFPTLIAWSMIVLGLLLFGKGAITLLASKAGSAGISLAFRRKELWAVVVFALMALYAYLFTRTTYLIASPAIACLTLAVFRVRIWYFYVIVCAFSALVYFLFARVMLVPLP